MNTTQRVLSRTAVIGVALASALLLGGCQSNGPGSSLEAALSQPSTDTADTKVSEIPSVTAEAYEAAYADFASCMKEAGVPLVNETMTGAIHDYAYPATEEGEAAYDKCYPDFQTADIGWQVANEWNSPTQVALRGCLVDAGVEPARTMDEVWQQILDAGIDPTECTLGDQAG